MILAVSSTTDEHTVAVCNELTRIGAPYTILDLSLFPQHIRLALRYVPSGGHDFSLQLPDQAPLNLTDCRAIWWRRPQPMVLHPSITRDSHRHFAFSESYEAFGGLWQTLDTFWVNHPTRDQVAHHKAWQLRIAQEVGLTIPHTLISNDPEQVRLFLAERGYERTVYKAFSATEQEWRETRILRREEVALIDNVQYAPVIFQEYIDAQYDLRITIAGDDIFPAAIYSQETAYKIDFRMDIANARIAAECLPPDVEERLRALMARMGLVYGAIDMRLTPDGHYVFLEINPAGQWLFIEQRSGQPITASLASVLAAAL